MDFEDFNGLNNYEINEISKAFLQEVQELTGKEVIIYSDLSNTRYTFNKELANEYPLWLAYYGDYERLENVQSNWDYWSGVQYRDNGIIPGISGYVDMDIYTDNIFLDNGYISEDLKNNNDDNLNTQDIIYVVKRGDTLWALSRKYNTTVNEIATVNNIPNPNLIFPGERLRIFTNSTVEGEEFNCLGNIIYTVKPGDCLYNIANTYGVTVDRIVQLNNIQNPDLIYPGEKFRL